MQYNQVTMAIWVKGRPIHEYHHNGQVFVEGRAGSEYEIEINNATNGKIETVLSVDGLCITDGKAAGNQSRGYVLEPHSTIRVPGWTVDTQTVAKFKFSGKDKSYATQMTGETRNNGVIGLMAYACRHVYRCNLPSFNPEAVWSASTVRGIAPTWNTSVYCNNSITTGMQNDYRGIIGKAAGATKTSDIYAENALGTAFGDASQFTTTKVDFIRGDMFAMMVLYYDTVKGLRSRGVKIESNHKRQPAVMPEAFPALSEGCMPPPGWQR